MSLLPALATTAWIATCRSGWRRFKEALAAPERAQAGVLAGIIEGASGTAFARDHGIPGKILDIEPMNYEEYAPYLDRVADGEAGVLTRAPVTRFEPTSGSTTASKLIPSTAPLRAQFEAAINPWMYDQYTSRPRLLGGPAYWSISPVVRRPPTPGGLPVGFEEDSAYLGRWGKALVDRALAVPGGIRAVDDVERFFDLTAVCLLAASDLRFVSVWNPSFWTILLDRLAAGWDRLLGLLAEGVRVGERVIRDPRRAALLRRLDPAHVTGIWPDLGLVSAWGDAGAAPLLPGLRARMPGVEVQPKGLLATEAALSIPFEGHYPVALLSAYVELLTDEGALLPLHRWSEGQEGEIVLSQGGGLIRYRLGDRVQVTGKLLQTPCIRFLGRAGRVSDRFGEKLSEPFVAAVLARLGLAGFAVLAPDGPGYTLYAEEPAPDLGVRLEAALRENVHYAWCVDLGQLTPARVFAISGDGAAAWLRWRAGLGQRLGEIKAPSLHLVDELGGVFQGAYGPVRP